MSSPAIIKYPKVKCVQDVDLNSNINIIPDQVP